MIKHIDVDGVPTVISPTSGPMHAGLMFRVGRADETLARGGITHLIEHLVLHPLGLVDYHYNGATGNVVTHFHLQGSERDIATFLTGVCAALGDLPMDRLETEKEILRTEAAGRGASVSDPLTMWRHGARDYGLQGYPEWGLSAFTPDDLRTWVARHFTRDNAVLWIAGDSVPAGLSLTLPGGVRRPAPRPSSALPVTPAYFAGSSRAVAWNTVVPRSSTAEVLSGVLERELFRELRQETGLSYTTQTDYDPRGDGMAVITAVADALPEKQDAVLGGFIDVLAKLRAGRVEAADVHSVIAKRADALDNAEADVARLPGYATNLLCGSPLQTAEELAGELRSVTVDAVTALAGPALDGGLLMTPDGRRADWAGFAKAPSSSDAVVRGTAYPSWESPQARAVAGVDGVSVVDGDAVLTVRYDACAAMLAWPDGGRLLIGHDAVSLRVEPTLYAGVDAVVPAIDAAVPADTRVDLPARPADEIPQPTSAPPPPGSALGRLIRRVVDVLRRARRR
jgi:zinc protease